MVDADRDGVMVIFSPDDRDVTLTQVLELGERDRRIEAAVLTGSIGSGRADRWSDIDVAFVIADVESSALVAADWVERLYREFPVAHHYETAFGTTLVRGFLLNDGLEVDLALSPAPTSPYGHQCAWSSIAQGVQPRRRSRPSHGHRRPTGPARRVLRGTICCMPVLP